MRTGWNAKVITTKPIATEAVATEAADVPAPGVLIAGCGRGGDWRRASDQSRSCNGHLSPQH